MKKVVFDKEDIINSFKGKAPTFFKIQRFVLNTNFNSLEPFDQEFFWPENRPSMVDPICLIGPNGSGKSNLLELLAEIFFYAELNTRYESEKKSRTKCPFSFTLDYYLSVNKLIRKIRLQANESTIQYLELVDDSEILEITEQEDIKKILPDKIVAYSSGMNESLSYRFLQSNDQYSDEVYELTNNEKDERLKDPRLIFFDYEMNSSVLVSNYLFNSRKKLQVIENKLRIKGIKSFSLVIKLKRVISNKDIIKLTPELNKYISLLRKCASSEYADESSREYQLTFEINRDLRKKFKEHFTSAYDLYMAFQKLTFLNSLNIEKSKRKIKGDNIERPTLSDEDKVFRIANLKVRIKNPDKVIDYKRISDGEHQYLHVVGLCLIMDRPNILFLLDEPETHFNPDWRSEIIADLNNVLSGKNQEYFMTTHSPFIVSDCNSYNVFVFKRVNDKVFFEPIDIETYGTSYDNLLRRTFNMKHSISKKAFEEIQNLLKVTDINKIEERLNYLGPSFEKIELQNHLKKLRDKYGSK